MKFLFIHQNFPGQFIHITRRLCDQGHTVVALGINPVDKNKPIHEKIQHFKYALSQGTTEKCHNLSKEVESKTIRGEGCAKACQQLKDKGFIPDIIYGHPGWGEMLFVKTIFPDTPMVCFQEYFYNEDGYDATFDPEFIGERTWQQKSGLIMKNAYLHLTLQQADWNISPTHFQAGTYPEMYRHKFSVIHDGIDVDHAKPTKEPKAIRLSDDTVLSPNDQIITFVNRRLEPYRGFHTFARAIPQIQKNNPNAKIVIVGRQKGVSYGAPCPEGEWKDMFMKEIEGKYDPSKVHFIGAIPYSAFIPLLQITKCHVYLTYPFVLSWSMIEAMSCGAPVIGSDTAPVREVIKHGHNGLLVDFFSPSDLASAVKEMLDQPNTAKIYGHNARNTVLRNYDMNECLDKQIAVLKMISSGNIG